jgi:hypothetical protein
VAGRLTLWGLLEQSWPVAWPVARLLEDIGPEAIEYARSLGLGRRTQLRAGMSYPCPRLCQAILTEDDEGLVAVCGQTSERCEDEPIAPAHAFLLEIDATTVTAVLQRLLRLPLATHGSDRTAIVLGTRRVGSRSVRFVLVPRPQLILNWVERTVREDPDRALVLITFTRGQVPAHSPGRVEGTRVEWVALEEALNSAGYLDLSDMWLRLGSAAVVAGELWPRFAFVVDEARAFWAYAGVRLPLERYPLEAQLLVLLLRRAGRPVPRMDLLLALWPEEFGGDRSPNLDVLDRRLRQVKAELSSQFKQLRLPGGVPQDPITNVRTRSDTAGGYQITVELEQVLFVE